MDDARIRAWWVHRQGLDGRLSGKRAGAGRATVDAAAAGLEIQELPCVRGCTYVVPAPEFALALKLGQGFAGEMRTAQKLGVTVAEIDTPCAAVLSALANGPLEPDDLRAATAGAVRNLGPEGTKKGLTTTLPVALEELQAVGEIRRIPTNGRLDQQRYRYALWRPNPLAGFRLSAEEAAIELALRYFAWIGPATLAEFQGFSGLGVRAVKAAVEPLKLESADGRMLLPGHRQELESFEAPPRALHNRKGRRFGRARCF
jgi:hypothetical protein